MEEMDRAGRGSSRRCGELLKTVLAIAQNRLELLLVELQQERWRFFDALLLAGAVLILAAMTLMLATITVVVVCVDAERLDLLVVLMLLCLAATITLPSGGCAPG